MSQHEKAINIARRLSARNEPDLLQENLYEGDKSAERLKCERLAARLSNTTELPKECLVYKDLVASIKSRETKTAAASAFAGMSAGEQQAAMAQRKKGKLSHAQIQRRLTNTRRFTKDKK